MRWRAVRGFPGYRVSDTGVVQSCWKLKHKKGRFNGYMIVRRQWRTLKAFLRGSYIAVILLNRAHQRKTVVVHRLMLLSFFGPSSFLEVARHLDGNCKNNTLKNLCWGTRKQNCADRDKHGRTARGLRNGKSKLSVKKIRLIRKRIKNTFARVLARRFNVATSTIYSVTSGRSWRQVS